MAAGAKVRRIVSFPILQKVRDVAGDADRPVTGLGQLPGRGAQRVLGDIDESDPGARLGECLRGRESDAGAGAGDKGGDLALKIINGIHLLVSSFMYVGSDSGDAVRDPHSAFLGRPSGDLNTSTTLQATGQSVCSTSRMYFSDMRPPCTLILEKAVSISLRSAGVS
jgi:hypothetical protein